eukprot:CAMPEP_0172576868 /NCGR_PEP_ID=MMETSP1067-20121228/137943_1 /TAXON_ID=265564 ORGANISM="Thalassiosira punctigera, Strain Tpunct2005C2" /NCGR_SAMPLE_ID=MMETSP1067 /ASSEMBLY_ACC=CAM_ASM_000444 /LENGTH=76 /DNA_ID=CAMNT_0013369547 /DNA_START=1244 /DNA_END=1474 /DNA_ORIENTATION=+
METATCWHPLYVGPRRWPPPISFLVSVLWQMPLGVNLVALAPMALVPCQLPPAISPPCVLLLPLAPLANAPGMMLL